MAVRNPKTKAIYWRDIINVPTSVHSISSSTSALLTSVAAGDTTVVVTTSGNTAVISAAGINSSNISTGVLAVHYGGTGINGVTTHCILVGEGESPMSAIAPSVSGQILTDQGSTSDPVFSTNISLPSGGTAKLNPSYAYLTGAQSTTISSTSTLMAGFGKNNSWGITPKISGNIKITPSGNYVCSSPSSEIVAKLYYGTGTAPAAGASLNTTTMTAAGVGQAFNSPGSNISVSVSWPVVVTSLSVNQAYWFDIGFSLSPVATCTIFNPSFIIEEFYG